MRMLERMIVPKGKNVCMTLIQLDSGLEASAVQGKTKLTLSHRKRRWLSKPI